MVDLCEVFLIALVLDDPPVYLSLFQDEEVKVSGHVGKHTCSGISVPTKD